MSTKRIVGPDWCPPIGCMGGSVHSWERGLDPWHRDAFPEDLQPQIPPATGKRKGGWYALDYWKNEIGFVADGTVWEEHRPSLEIQVIGPEA